MARVLHWNGKDVPAELRELPAGRYIVQELDAEDMTVEEEEGILEALEAIDRGEGSPAREVFARLDEMLKR